MTETLQNLIRLLAEYRERLEHEGELNAAALLRALIAEIEGAPSDGPGSRS